MQTDAPPPDQSQQSLTVLKIILPDIPAVCQEGFGQENTVCTLGNTQFLW